MNKSELIEALAAKTDVSKAAAGKSVDALVEIITAAVAKGNDVALIPDFDTSKAHFSLTPSNGADFRAPSRKSPRYMDC